MNKRLPSVVWQPDTITTDFDRLFRYALLWGFDGLELRTIGSATQRIPDIREPNLARRLAESGLFVTACDPGLFEGSIGDRAGWLNDLEVLKDVIAFNTRLGITATLIDAFENGYDSGREAWPSNLEPFRKALGIAQTKSQRLLVRSNNVGWMVELVREMDDPAFAGVWEPASQKDLENATEFAHHVGMVRFVLDVPHINLERALIDHGALWETALTPLAESGFSGPICLELTTDRPGPVGLAVTTELIRTVKRVFS